MLTLERKTAISNPKQVQILQGALEMFLKQGYERTSMDRIAAAAGVSKNTIYSHFQDKEGLFTALIEKVTQERFQIVFGQLPLVGEPAIVLRRIAETLLTTILADQEYIAFLRLIIAESDRFPQLSRLFVRALPQKILQTLGSYLAMHPELNLPNIEATARIFMSSLMGYIFLQEVLHGGDIVPLNKEQLIETLLALIIRQ